MDGPSYVGSDRPTLAEIAVKAGRSIQDVRQAVVDRNVRVRESRVDAMALPTIYAGLKAIPEAECQHEHWYEDEDRDHRRVHVCEDCGESIRVSEIERQEP